MTPNADKSHGAKRARAAMLRTAVPTLADKLANLKSGLLALQPPPSLTLDELVAAMEIAWASATRLSLELAEEYSEPRPPAPRRRSVAEPT